MPDTGAMQLPAREAAPQAPQGPSAPAAVPHAATTQPIAMRGTPSSFKVGTRAGMRAGRCYTHAHLLLGTAAQVHVMISDRLARHATILMRMWPAEHHEHWVLSAVPYTVQAELAHAPRCLTAVLSPLAAHKAQGAASFSNNAESSDVRGAEMMQGDRRQRWPLESWYPWSVACLLETTVDSSLSSK